MTEMTHAVHQTDLAPEPPSVKLRDIHVVLPAYNEEASLGSLLRRLEEFAAEFTADFDHRVKVWVVDDGSADATAEIAARSYGDLRVQVIRHPSNRGLGQAVRTGLAEVVRVAYRDDAVVVMDADDTHDVNLILLMARALERGADIAIASRFVDGGDDHSAPGFRRFLSRAAAWVFRLGLPLDHIHDFTSGYRAYRVSLLRRAIAHYGERLVEEQGFAVMVELLLKLRHANPVIVEVPMVLRYDRKGSASKLKLGRTIRQYLALFARDRLAPPPFRSL